MKTFVLRMWYMRTAYILRIKSESDGPGFISGLQCLLPV